MQGIFRELCKHRQPKQSACVNMTPWKCFVWVALQAQLVVRIGETVFYSPISSDLSLWNWSKVCNPPQLKYKDAQQPCLSPGIGCHLYLKFLNSGEKDDRRQPHHMDFKRILILVLPVRSLDGLKPKWDGRPLLANINSQALSESRVTSKSPED